MYPGAYAQEVPNRPAVIMSDTGASMSFAELEERSACVARLLYERGLRRGDNFAVLAENCLEFYALYWAALRSGLYITAINHHLMPSEIAYIVNDCGARVLFVSASKADKALALIEQTPAVESRLAFGGAVANHEVYEEVLSATASLPTEDDRVGGDMLYSSGTTGVPKAIKMPLQERRVHETGDPYLAVFGKMYGFDSTTVYLTPAPLYHAAPLRFGGWVHAMGGTVVVMPAFDPMAALEAIEEYGVTHSQWVPTMFIRMLKLPDADRERFDHSSLRVAVHAAAPCPVDVKSTMIDWWGPILYEYYSCTEGMGVTLIAPEEWIAKPGSVGKAGLGILHICNGDGDEAAVGDVGTIYFERDALPFSYHNDPIKTAGAQHPQHATWTTAGDVGRIDEDGYLYLTDREAFMIISGGVNIYPQEIENVLALHPKVLDIAVIGVPDDEMGEQVKAVVQAAPGVETGPDLEREILEFVRERIAHFKAPKSVDFVDELPRTATGKLQKNKVRDLYV